MKKKDPFREVDCARAMGVDYYQLGIDAVLPQREKITPRQVLKRGKCTAQNDNRGANYSGHFREKERDRERLASWYSPS